MPPKRKNEGGENIKEKKVKFTAVMSPASFAEQQASPRKTRGRTPGGVMAPNLVGLRAAAATAATEMRVKAPKKSNSAVPSTPSKKAGASLVGLPISEDELQRKRVSPLVKAVPPPAFVLSKTPDQGREQEKGAGEEDGLNVAVVAPKTRKKKATTNVTASKVTFSDVAHADATAATEMRVKAPKKSNTAVPSTPSKKAGASLVGLPISEDELQRIRVSPLAKAAPPPAFVLSKTPDQGREQEKGAGEEDGLNVAVASPKTRRKKATPNVTASKVTFSDVAHADLAPPSTRGRGRPRGRGSTRGRGGTAAAAAAAGTIRETLTVSDHPVATETSEGPLSIAQAINIFSSARKPRSTYAGPVTELGVTLLKQHVMGKLSGKGRRKLVGFEEEYNQVSNLLEQTVVAGEGNSMLVIGPRGVGKSTVSIKCLPFHRFTICLLGSRGILFCALGYFMMR